MAEAELPSTKQITEQNNPATENLDLLPTVELLQRINDEDRGAAWAVKREIDGMASAVDAIATRLRGSGKLHYFGAGTSGRLGVLDAAEMQPTFGAGDLVVAHIAGGPDALRRPIEGAEDDAQAGEDEARNHLGSRDAAIGISASGETPFVLGALRTAEKLGALTVCITNNPDSALARAVRISVVLRTGAEAITGSTRMKAAAAQKMALTMISTAVMVKLGKVYSNEMIDMVATSAKLRRRAALLTARLTGADEESIKGALEQTGYRIKPAVVMLWCHCSMSDAEKKLGQADGNLRWVRAKDLGSPA